MKEWMGDADDDDDEVDCWCWVAQIREWELLLSDPQNEKLYINIHRISFTRYSLLRSLWKVLI